MTEEGLEGKGTGHVAVTGWRLDEKGEDKAVGSQGWMHQVLLARPLGDRLSREARRVRQDGTRGKNAALFLGFILCLANPAQACPKSNNAKLFPYVIV